MYNITWSCMVYLITCNLNAFVKYVAVWKSRLLVDLIFLFNTKQCSAFNTFYVFLYSWVVLLGGSCQIQIFWRILLWQMTEFQLLCICQNCPVSGGNGIRNMLLSKYLYTVGSKKFLKKIPEILGCT